MKCKNSYFHSLQKVMCLQPQCITVVVTSDNPQIKKKHHPKMKFPSLGPSCEFPHFLSLPCVCFLLNSNMVLFLTCCYSKGYFKCYFGFVPHAKLLVFITRGILMLETEATSWAATTFLSHDSLLQTL